MCFGLRGVWLGLAKHQCLGSGEQGKVQDHESYMCRFCKGFWKARRGGTRLLQITGWHRDKATCLQLVMDEPPEQLYNQWIRDRMEFYKRVEPTEPPGMSGWSWALPYSILVAHVGFSGGMAVEPRHSSLISSTMRPHALAVARAGQPRFGKSGCGRLMVSLRSP